MNEDLRELIERAGRAQVPRPVPDRIAWPDNDGLDPEVAILRDAEAMVEAGLADWIEPDRETT